ncbi:MAG: MFS transporter [Pseudomonadota bacterium]
MRSVTNPVQRLLSNTFDIRANELRATLASFGLVLILMGSYYILRPVRDAMASDWSDAEVSWLWTFTFFFSTAAVFLYGAAVARLSVKVLVPCVYGFFALSFVLFYAGTHSSADAVLVDKAFYVWVSLFALFHISVFWSFMSDTFARPQATRLFGFIGAGASVGAIGGPTFAALLVGDLGTDHLLLVAAGMLVLAMPLIIWLQRLKSSDLHNEGVTASISAFDTIGGGALGGFSEFLKSRYLLMIGLFIFCFTFLSSFVYFELKNLLADFTIEERTRIWSLMDLVVNTFTIVVGTLVTGRLASRLGLPFTLACVPALMCLGMLTLAATPVAAIAVLLQVVRRIGNYAITRPAREMLFTAVSQETRFKAKPVIDIVIYRGGDMVNAWAFTALTQGLGLGLGAVASVGAGVAIMWASIGIYLGRQFNQLRPAQTPSNPVAEANN